VLVGPNNKFNSWCPRAESVAVAEVELCYYGCNEKEIHFYLTIPRQELRVIWFCENYVEYGIC
jgi:hypothetical protein